MFAALIPAAAGLLGGGDKGAAGGPIKQSQDGNSLTSGTGDFSVGGGPPKWLWPVVLGVVAVVGLLAWKPWKT